MADPKPASSPTILLVEDEPAIRMLMRRMLEQRSYVILEARNGVEAVAVAGSRKEPLDLVITDVVMPGMDGFEVAQRLAESHPETKVLFLSGHADFSSVREGLRGAGRPFLLKPFTQDELAQKIKEVLEAAS